MTRRQGLVKIRDTLGEMIESLDRVTDAIANVRSKLEAMVEALNDINSHRDPSRQRSQARIEDDQCMSLDLDVVWIVADAYRETL